MPSFQRTPVSPEGVDENSKQSSRIKICIWTVLTIHETRKFKKTMILYNTGVRCTEELCNEERVRTCNSYVCSWIASSSVAGSTSSSTVSKFRNRPLKEYSQDSPDVRESDWGMQNVKGHWISMCSNRTCLGVEPRTLHRHRSSRPLLPLMNKHWRT